MENRRSDKRFDCELPATLEHRSGSLPCIIKDISSGGFSLATGNSLSLAQGEEITVTQPELGKLTGAVRWTAPGKLGVQLDDEKTGPQVIRAINEFINVQ